MAVLTKNTFEITAGKEEGTGTFWTMGVICFISGLITGSAQNRFFAEMEDGMGQRSLVNAPAEAFFPLFPVFSAFPRADTARRLMLKQIIECLLDSFQFFSDIHFFAWLANGRIDIRTVIL